MDHIVDPNSFLRAIDEAHYHGQAELFCNYYYDYAYGIMSVYFSSTVDPVDSQYAIAVYNIDEIWLPEVGYCMVMLKERYYHRAVEVSKERNRVEGL